MTIPEQLGQLGELHRSGVLSDDEFSRAKAHVLGDAGAAGATPAAAINALRRSRSDRWLGGVCGGVARITGVATWLWRALFVLLVLCGGTGALLYLLLWILVPEDEVSLAGREGRMPAG
jgi:phage shock protein PspC (stress-responsive transcriptional regulator)